MEVRIPIYLLALQSRPWTNLYVVCMLSGTGTLPFSPRYVSDLIACQCNGDGNYPNFPL